MTVEYRPLRDGDYATLALLFNAASVVDGRAQHQAAEELQEEFEALPVDLPVDTLAAWQGDALLGAVYMWYLRSDVREERCYVLGTVHPDHRGRGIGRHLLAWGLERAAALLRSSGNDLPKFIRVDAPHTNTSALRLFERFGLDPIRYFADLRADLSATQPPLRLATGFRIIPWNVDCNEEVRHVRNSAFMDHWGSTPVTAEWWTAQTTGFGSRPDWSYFAVDTDDRIVGYVITHRYDNDDELLGAKYAWIDNIGTLAEWRGRGVASRLISAALDTYRRHGMHFAALGVDSANPTGAYRLYESLGFRPWRQFVTYQREVARR